MHVQPQPTTTSARGAGGWEAAWPRETRRPGPKRGGGTSCVRPPVARSPRARSRPAALSFGHLSLSHPSARRDAQAESRAYELLGVHPATRVSTHRGTPAPSPPLRFPHACRGGWESASGSAGQRTAAVLTRVPFVSQMDTTLSQLSNNTSECVPAECVCDVLCVCDVCAACVCTPSFPHAAAPPPSPFFPHPARPLPRTHRLGGLRPPPPSPPPPHQWSLTTTDMTAAGAADGGGEEHDDEVVAQNGRTLEGALLSLSAPPRRLPVFSCPRPAFADLRNGLPACGRCGRDQGGRGAAGGRGVVVRAARRRARVLPGQHRPRVGGPGARTGGAAARRGADGGGVCAADAGGT